MFKTSLGLVGLPIMFSLQAIATPLVPAPACPVASLAVYLGISTCNVGELGFTQFNFSVLSASEGTQPISASDVTVRPVFIPGGVENLPSAGLFFSSPGFSVIGNQSVTYSLSYSIDPHPIIVNLDDTLDTSSPIFPGIASITTELCVGGHFPQITLDARVLQGIGCVSEPGSLTTFAATLNVFDNGRDRKLFDTTGTFQPVNFIDVENTILLAANGSKADFNNFSNSAHYIPDTLVPEPASCGLIGGGLLILWRMSRRRASV